MVINGIGGINNPGRSFSGKISRDGGFSKVLGEKMTETAGIPPKRPFVAGMGVLEKGDRVLNLLDEFARDLADPEKSVKDIRPLVDRLERDVVSLEAGARERAGENRELMGLVDDVAVTAKVALLKFHRGDYV